MRGFPHQAHAGCGRIPFMPINGLRPDMKRKNGEKVPAAVRIGSPSVPRCLCIGQGVTFVKLMLSDGVALYPCACRCRDPEPSILGNRQCTPCAYPRPPVRWGNPRLQAMRIEHEAAYRAGDKAGMDEEGFGADGKETEVQEDNQAEAGERGERFGQSGKEEARAPCTTCACPCVIPQWLRRQSGDFQVSHPLEGKWSGMGICAAATRHTAPTARRAA